MKRNEFYITNALFKFGAEHFHITIFAAFYILPYKIKHRKYLFSIIDLTL